MHGFHEISGHKAWYTESGSHHMRVKLPTTDDGAEDPDEPSVRRMITFTYRLPFWTRVKVLLGWRLVVRYTAIDGLDGLRVEVGTAMPPDWWPFDTLALADKEPCK